MSTLTITRALAEIKLLDKRIMQAINSGRFVGIAKAGNVNGGFKTVEELEENITSNYASIESLMKRRNAIKSGVSFSNAVTIVTIGKKDMTVAAAIDRKNYIEVEERLVSVMRTKLAEANNVIANENANVDSRLDRFLEASFGSDAKSSKNSDKEGVIEQFLENNVMTLVDPLGVISKQESRSRDIDSFLTEVDYVLSESNALTTIEVKE